MTNIDMNTLPEAEHEKFHRLLAGVNAVISEVFDLEADHPAIVLGVQWGEMGNKESEWPDCAVTSNLPSCLIGQALEDMADFAEAQHDEFHAMNKAQLIEAAQNAVGSHEDANTVSEEVSFDSLPDKAKEVVRAFMDELGISEDNVEFEVHSVADMSDLAALPESNEG